MIAVVDLAFGTHRTYSVYDEAVGQLGTGCAHSGTVVGISRQANTFAVVELLVPAAVVAGTTIGSRHRSLRTNGADPGNTCQTFKTGAFQSVDVVYFVGEAFLGANAELVGEVTFFAITFVGGWVYL